MPEYRRSYVQGGTYFFTLVTYHRNPILVTPISRNILRFALEDVQGRFPFKIKAVCLMPDHLHCIWTLPDGDADFSKRWSEIKRLYSKNISKHIVLPVTNDQSRLTRRESTVWQRRFWKHTIRDEEDFRRHMNYIHYNPVKHNLVTRVKDWPWSSFHRYVKLEYYEDNWGDGYGQNISFSHDEF
jgi:putative transposase